MKKLCTAVFFFCAACTLFAADIAEFYDIGFSPDASAYAFANYGVASQNGANQRGYAELFVVDTAKNAYIKEGIYKNGPNAKTANKDGFQTFQDLLSANEKSFKTFRFPAYSNSVVLYQVAQPKDKSKASPEYKPSVTFRDFSNPVFGRTVTYSVKVNEFVEGVGANANSAFCILLEIKSESGNVLKRYVVGNPQYKRQGVIAYRLNRVLRDEDGKKLVFVIEKQIAQSDGMSIRFMVETLALE